MSVFGDVKDLKPNSDPVEPICRGCLSTDRHLISAHFFSIHFREITGIIISESDGLPQWICKECGALLNKTLRFKYKLLRAHTLLYEYSERCAPFPIDGGDAELLKYTNPTLSAASTLCVDYSGRGRLGFHKVLRHNTPAPPSPLALPVEASPFTLHAAPAALTAPGAPAAAAAEPPPPLEPDIGLKQEGFSDYEDNIPLGDYKTSMSLDTISEQDLQRFLNDDAPSPPPHRRRRGRKKEKQKEDDSTRLPRARLRAAPDVNPLHIRVVQLDPGEQMAAAARAARRRALPHTCALCHKGFNFKEKLENHMRKHSPERGRFECAVCRMFLPTAYSHSVHMAIHTRRYECLKCGVQMTDRGSIIEHHRTQHEGLVTQFKCEICGKVSTNNKTHRGHLRNHHSGARPACAACGKTFVNDDSLRDHLLIHEGVKAHECGACGKRFRTKAQVTHHQLRHRTARDYYCVECDVRFKSAHNLRQHLTRSLKHQDQSTFKYPCALCPRRYPCARTRDAHARVQHDGSRQHACGRCGAALASRSALAKHERRHAADQSSERPFPCALCGRRFAARAARDRHARRHQTAQSAPAPEVKPEAAAEDGVDKMAAEVDKMAADVDKMAADGLDKMADKDPFAAWRDYNDACRLRIEHVTNL